MHINAIQASIPSRILDNSEILELVREHSQRCFVGDLDAALARIDRLLQLSGAQRRRWLAEGETPIAHIKTAIEGALDQAEVTREEVDLLIYVGIGKGFTEPGQSYLVAHAMGVTRLVR